MAAAGFDFVEWPMSRTVGEMDDAAFADLAALARDLPVTPEAWNVMLPGTLKVVGPEVDPAALERYLETAFARAEALGGRIVVFGSGGARTIPEGWSAEEATRQFEDACRIAGDAARRHGLTIAIEPLRREETNLVNHVREAVAIAERVDHPAVQVLSDLYHVTAGNEPFADTGAAAPRLAHVHVAAPGTRTLPVAGEHEDAYRDYFAVLRDAGYDARVSLECRDSTPERAGEALRMLRALWSEVAARA
jgi:sugar phosphate isomerase/epimerase